MKIHSPFPAVKKVLTGIQGFDEITDGGLPSGRTTLVMGGAGCGKTVFALQTLVNGAHRTKEAGVFVAFEESTRQIVANAGTFGWDLPTLEKKKLFFLDARLSPEVVKTGEFDLVGMLSFLRTKVEEIHATCIVFDGFDVLLALLDDPVVQRREIYRVRDWLSQMGLTGIITQKVGSGIDAEQRYGFLQFMVDSVVVLRHHVVDGSAFRNLRVMKYRGSGFAGDEFPISLTKDGLQLTTRGPTELRYEVTDERISSGLPRLDNMLRGGYYRGCDVLISGAPGTAKSTLAGLFAAAACERGERTLYVSFDEGAAQIVRNLRSVGIRLAPHVKSGMLRMYSTRTRGPNVEDQFGALRAKVREHNPRCLVIDPLSALSTKVEHRASADASQQFLDFLKAQGITVVNTTLTGVTNDETTTTGISAIADTWIHVSYVVQDGERNRALTIVKSRGTGHSNQVRELTLSDEGVTLTDVFVAQGKVLMGVARWQWEQEEQANKERTHVAAELKRLQLQLAQAEAAARLQVVKTEMEARSAEIAVLADATGSASKLLRTDKAVMRKMRHADEDIRVSKAVVANDRKNRLPDAY
jgi:circadian clock protein KaiC